MRFDLARRNRCRFHFDVFISYSTQQKQQAEELLGEFSKLGVKTFYAPVSLKTSEVTPNQYVDSLREALIQSCQVVVLLSAAYLDSSWCLLEMRGYFGLVKNNRKRRLWIHPLEAVDSQLIGQLVPFLFRGTLTELALETHRVADKGEIKVADAFAELELPRMFVELPLRDFYEPPGRHNRPPWGKDHRSPHGVPGAPPFAVYEELVREYMVQIMRGHKLGQLGVPMLGVPEAYSYFAEDAERDARKLIELDVSPFRLTYTYPLGERLREITVARAQGQDAAEMDRLEGQAWTNAGHFDKGIRLIRSGLGSASEPLRDRSYWVTEIARAEYLARRDKAALVVLEELAELDGPEHEQARLVRCAAMARLGRLADEEIQRNQESDVSVNNIRIESPIEHREHLDWWADGLELAGFRP